MEGAITWQAISYFVALLLPGAAALFGVWSYIDRQIKSAQTNVSNRIDLLERDISEYKLHVSEKFIKAGDLEKMERRLMDTEARTLAALEQLTKRIDNLISEISSEHRHQQPRTRAS